MSIENTVFYSLVFDYDLRSMENSGRHWASEAYRSKDYIFSYSAASIATVMHVNPTIEYVVLVDDAALLEEKLSKYDVDLSNLCLRPSRDVIEAWKSERSYCFWPAVAALTSMVSSNPGRRVVKLDNDLTALRPLDDEFFSHRGSHVWRRERKCSEGREYWGERLASRIGLGTEDFDICNIGVFSVSPEHHHLAEEFTTLTDAVAGVDISRIVHFPDNPTATTKMWACAEQTAESFWLRRHSILAMETTKWFDHHCYKKTKEDVEKRAEGLLK